MIENTLLSIREELDSMTSGHFVPYHVLSVIVSLFTCVFFSFVFVNNAIYDGEIAVIDLDQSQTSTALIEKLDTSRYIKVATVEHHAIDPRVLLTSDQHLGVLYIGPGFEKSIKRHDQKVAIGYFADSSNASQNATINSNLQSIISQALSDEGISQTMVSVVSRNLFNVTGTYTNTIMSGFMFFFPSIYIGITLVMLVGRMHVSGLWTTIILERGIVAFLARLIPYAFFYTAAITFSLGLLSCFNNLRFVGNIWLLLPVIFLTAIAIGLCAMFLTFNTKNQASGSAFMVFVVPPGFMFGGMTVATALLPQWCQFFAHLFPLTWLFSFYRDIALRGAGFATMLPTYGAFILYLVLLIALVSVRFFKERSDLIKRNRDLSEINEMIIS